MAKVAVIGLTPFYMYGEKYNKNDLVNFKRNLYSTNHGACFISKSLIEIFNADYIDFNEIKSEEFNEKNYEVCILALASMLGPNRDLYKLCEFLEKINCDSFFVSGGIDSGYQYDQNTCLHPSVIKVLEICSSNNKWIGVRGFISSLLVAKYGFKNVATIGCPTMFSKDITFINNSKKVDINKMVFPFFPTTFIKTFRCLDDVKLIGQDCIDHEVFRSKTERKKVFLDKSNFSFYRNFYEYNNFDNLVKKNLVVFDKYSEWYRFISNQEAILSARLHANICGLVNGKKSLLIKYDNRCRELIDYFKIPSIDVNEIKSKINLEDKFNNFDFHTYNNNLLIVRERWHNFLIKNNLHRYLKNTNIEKNSNFNFASFENEANIYATISKNLPTVLKQTKIEKLKKFIKRILRSNN